MPYVLKRLEAILPEIEGGPDFAREARRRSAELVSSALMPALKERAKTLVDLFHAMRFLAAARPLALDEKATALLDAEARARLGRLAETLRPGRVGRCRRSKQAVRAFAEAEGVKLGKVAQPLRAALTGSAASPPIFDVLVALGREESLARLGSGRIANRAFETSIAMRLCPPARAVLRRLDHDLRRPVARPRAIRERHHLAPRVSAATCARRCSVSDRSAKRLARQHLRRCRPSSRNSGTAFSPSTRLASTIEGTLRKRFRKRAIGSTR